MIIEILGWVSTALVLLGFWFNARNARRPAFMTWIVGDVGWITYDIFIDNWSHLVLSAVIIAMNIYGMINMVYKNDSKGHNAGQ